MIRKIKHKLRFGLRHAWYYDVVRRRINKTPPVIGLSDATCELHVITSIHDWLNLLWALKSFYFATRRRYMLTIHDDGSFSDDIVRAFNRHFPDARVVTKAVADAEVLPTLEPYPHCLTYRRENPLAIRVFDFTHYLRSDRMLALDSDVLFFTEPAALLRRIEDPSYRKNSFNEDADSFYTLDPEKVLSETGVTLAERFNAGFGLVHKASIDYAWVNTCLGLHERTDTFPRPVDQTLLALCACRFGLELLPEEYRIHLEAIDERRLPCRHYPSAARRYMYEQGLPRLIGAGLLRWRSAETLQVPAAMTGSSASTPLAEVAGQQ